MDFDKVIQKKMDVVVKIIITAKDFDSPITGTGFLYGKNGYIITNHHVMEPFLKDDKTKNQILFKGEETSLKDIKIVKCSDEKKIDLCILKVPKLKRAYFPIRKDKIAKSYTVASLGMCGNHFNIKKSTVDNFYDDAVTYVNVVKNYKAMVRQKRNFNTKTVVLKESKLCPGDSGGSVFGVNGELVGVVSNKIPIIQSRKIVGQLDNIVANDELYTYFKKFSELEGTEIANNRVGFIKTLKEPFPEYFDTFSYDMKAYARKNLTTCLEVKKKECFMQTNIFCKNNSETDCKKLRSWILKSLKKTWST